MKFKYGECVDWSNWLDEPKHKNLKECLIELNPTMNPNEFYQKIINKVHDTDLTLGEVYQHVFNVPHDIKSEKLNITASMFKASSTVEPYLVSPNSISLHVSVVWSTDDEPRYRLTFIEQSTLITTQIYINVPLIDSFSNDPEEIMKTFNLDYAFKDIDNTLISKVLGNKEGVNQAYLLSPIELMGEDELSKLYRLRYTLD